MSDRIASELWRWRGVLLVAALAIATLWMAATGTLVLYIHPRYVVFTVIFAVLALAFCVARLALAGREQAHGHAGHTEHDDHAGHDDHDDEPAPATRRGRLLAAGALGLSGLLALAAVLLPPATLSSATAAQRDITDTSVAASAEVDPDAADSVTATYTVLQWASLLSQTSDPAYFADKHVDVVGFVTPDPQSADVYWVSRFVVTCCAVDAQPVGIPVYDPDWQSTIAADDWVEVSGVFAANPSTTSSSTLALQPAEVTGVDQPSNPYLT